MKTSRRQCGSPCVTGRCYSDRARRLKLKLVSRHLRSNRMATIREDLWTDWLDVAGWDASFRSDMPHGYKYMQR
jgi:hypothetical protein